MDAAAVLEPLGQALDSFAMQIFASIWRLEEVVQPRWMLVEGGQGGHLVFSEDTGPFQKHSKDLRLYQALQGVCIWTLALVVRTVGYSQFTASLLWEFCSGDALCTLVFAKGALSFTQASSETSCVRVPRDILDLRNAVVGAVLGLTSQDIVFATCTDATQDENLDISVRNQTLFRHHALLAAVAADNGLLHCLLGFPWASVGTPRLLSLASFLGALVASISFSDSDQELELWGQQVTESSVDLWRIFAPLAVARRGFLRNCAGLAYSAPPSVDAKGTLLLRCLSEQGPDSLLSDICALAALVAFASNAGSIPESGEVLTEALSHISFEVRANLCATLRDWHGPVRDEVLASWIAYVNAPALEAAAEKGEDPWFSGVSDPWAAALQRKSEEANTQRTPLLDPAPASLRDLMSDVPVGFRCSFDGKFLVDPVRAPSGHVFERSVLAREIEARDGRCPVTGTLLALEWCQRDAELRTQIVKWIRANLARKF